MCEDLRVFLFVSLEKNLSGLTSSWCTAVSTCCVSLFDEVAVRHALLCAKCVCVCVCVCVLLLRGQDQSWWCNYYPMRMRSRGKVIGLSVSRPNSLSSEGLVEGLVQDRSVRIQKIIVSTQFTDQRSTREAEKSCVKVVFLIYTTWPHPVSAITYGVSFCMLTSIAAAVENR